jgi:hypothetical protein
MTYERWQQRESYRNFLKAVGGKDVTEGVKELAAKLLTLSYYHPPSEVWVATIGVSVSDKRRLSYQKPDGDIWAVIGWGKLIRKLAAKNLLEGATDADIERLSNIAGAYFGNFHLDKVEVLDISEIYNVYASNGLGSCMHRYGKQGPDEYNPLEFYAKNPEVFALAVLRDDDDKVIGRALLVNTDQGARVMGRIYPSDTTHDAYLTLEAWAQQQGYDLPVKPTYKSEFRSGNRYTVTVYDPDKAYPYVDIWQFGEYLGNGKMRLYQGVDSGRIPETNADHLYLFSGTGGDTEEVYWVKSVNNYMAESEVVQCDAGRYAGEYIRYSDAVEVDGVGYVHIDDTVELANGDRVLEEDAVYIDYRDSYYHVDDTVIDYIGNPLYVDDAEMITFGPYEDEFIYHGDAHYENGEVMVPFDEAPNAWGEWAEGKGVSLAELKGDYPKCFASLEVDEEDEADEAVAH